MEKYSIRKANTNDTKILIDIAEKVTEYNFKSFIDITIIDEYIKNKEAEKLIKNHIKQTDTLIDKDTSNIIGFCVWDKPQIQMLMIHPLFQGTGAAGYFINEMVKDKFKTYNTLYLESFKENSRANSYYEKMGWDKYKTRLDEELNLNRVYYKKTRII